MSLPVLIAFAGVPVAAVATGMLAGRCVRQPRMGFIVWTAATLGLTIALAAQSIGFASGFGPTTFRAVQLFALMLAPLWLSWGLVEVAVASEGARFGVRLISSALPAGSACRWRPWRPACSPDGASASRGLDSSSGRPPLSG